MPEKPNKNHKSHRKQPTQQQAQQHIQQRKQPSLFKRVWRFLWEDNSIWSWLANIVIAFILIKFIVYPGLGLVLGTKYPVVAVVSGSMQHDSKLDEWYSSQEYVYALQYNISKEQFSTFIFSNGFNKGDIIILKGASSEKIRVGDVLVFRTSRKDPVIHRIVEIKSINGQYFFHTKGDHNIGSLEEELNISEQRVIGRAVFRIPALGWVKIWFSELFGFSAAA